MLPYIFKEDSMKVLKKLSIVDVQYFGLLGTVALFGTLHYIKIKNR